jgi:hypothetical protein
MNPLIEYLRAKGLNPTKTMNRLQEFGVVADTCVTAEDVGNPLEAIAWLESQC